MESQGYTLGSILDKDVTVYLKTTSNISSGGDSVDATERIPSYIKEEAVKAVKSIPGLLQGGVDVLYNESSNEYAIIEVNSQPSIRAHLFPMKGKARDIPKEIIDYYFPESIEDRNMDNPLYYFDIKTVFSSFLSNNIEKIGIPPVPTKKIVMNRYNMVGDLNYGKWVQKQARTLKLNGYIKFLDKRNVEILCSGPNKQMEDFDLAIRKSNPRGLEEKAIQSNKISINDIAPIQVGFRIVKKEKLNPSFKKLRDKEYRKRKRINKELKHYKRKHEEMLHSTSWRITKPLRLVGKVKNKLKRN